MTIQFQDKNLIVSYLQLFLREVSGLTLKITDSSVTDYSANTTYEITMSTPIAVDGTFTLQTYFSTALYMAYNYPKEGYPELWYQDKGQWVSEDYAPDKLKSSVNLMIDGADEDSLTDPEEFYNALLKATYDQTYEEALSSGLSESEAQKVADQYMSDNYLSWSQLLRYFENEEELIALIREKTYTSGEFSIDNLNKCLINILVSNMKLATVNPQSLRVTERVLSYIFDEVVSESSEPDEVLRVQKLMYPPNFPGKRAGVYDDIMRTDVETYQRNFIKGYTSKEGVIELPQGFTGFKVTGYVDPWTEWVIKGGVDIG